MKQLIPLLFLVTGTIFADAPLGPAGRTLSHSQNVRYIAVSDPNEGTEIYKIGEADAKWKINQWFRSHFISNDGEYFVTQYDGLNLITPSDYSPELPLVTVWKNGEKTKEYKVKDFFPDGKGPQKTVSHYYWGGTAGINEKNQIEVHLSEKGIIFLELENESAEPSGGHNSGSSAASIVTT